MAEQVGTKGRVLATDLSLELMAAQGLEAENLELRRLDILSDPLPDEEFDLIHCRLVLEHLPGRLDALARMAGALAPGGWLVVESLTFGTEHSGTRRGAALLGGVVQTLRLLLRRNGFDGGFGRRLPIHIGRLGLNDIGAEGTQVVLIGGTPSVELGASEPGANPSPAARRRERPRSRSPGQGPGCRAGAQRRRAPPRRAGSAPGRPGVRLSGADDGQRLGPPPRDCLVGRADGEDLHLEAPAGRLVDHLLARGVAEQRLSER